MLLRNRELMGAMVAWIALTATITVAGSTLAGSMGAGIALASCFLGALPFVALTCLRYRQLAQLSANIDAVLHGERDLDFSSMAEGELAVLSNELDKMVTRLNLTIDELAHEKQALADALADISHQIKTPLTSLSITTELMRKHLIEIPECAEDLDRLRRIEQLEMRVEHLVGTLLKLARLDAGTVSLARETVAVETMVRRATQPLAVALDIAGVSLEVDVAEGCSFTGDLAWSAEALENIVKNCMEHTPSGGHVRIVAWEDALACRIRVTDTGPGIADEDLPHIFERFYRGAHDADGSSAVNPAGVGIGLSLAQSLIAAQEGSLAASNARDASGTVTGAQFDIAFFKAIV